MWNIRPLDLLLCTCGEFQTDMHILFDCIHNKYLRVHDTTNENVNIKLLDLCKSCLLSICQRIHMALAITRPDVR